MLTWALTSLEELNSSSKFSQGGATKVSIVVILLWDNDMFGTGGPIFKLVMVDSSLAWGVTCQVVVMAALAIFPLTPAGLSSRAYRFALLGSVIACAHSLYQQHQVCDSTH